MTIQLTRRAALGLVAGGLVVPFMPAAASAETLRSGALEGTAGHTATGSVSIVKEGDAINVVFSNDYSLDNAPDPYVAFGDGSAYADGTDFVKMKSLKGAQTYSLPGNIDHSDYSAVWLWCRRFGVPLAFAPLS